MGTTSMNLYPLVIYLLLGATILAYGAFTGNSGRLILRRPWLAVLFVVAWAPLFLWYGVEMAFEQRRNR